MRVHVITHTHWDREWYMSFEMFRGRLLNLFQDLLSKLEKYSYFKHFMFDGQTIVLKDYLEFRGDDLEKIKDLVKKEKLIFGPWYILPDEFLITGEAFIRNYLFGQRILRKFGIDGMNVGYLPDMFGHNAYTPTILKGLGLETAVIWRGVGDKSRRTEFIWRSPNGDEVLALNLIRSYSNGAIFGDDIETVKERYKKEIEELSKHRTTNNILIMNGTDHEFPNYEIVKHFKEWGREFNVEFVHSTFDEYVRSVMSENPDLDVVVGELRSPKYEYILRDVTSTRIYLKTLNFESEILYQRYLEPLSVILKKKMDKEVGNAEINYGWDLILQSHPHDSICGCSVDQVHDEVEVRLRKSLEIGFIVLAEMMRISAECVKSKDEDSILVFNPYERERTEIIEILLPLDTDNVKIVDEEGNELEVYHEFPGLEIIDSSEFDLFFIPMISKFSTGESFQNFMNLRKLRIQANLKPLGFTVLKMMKDDAANGDSKDERPDFEGKYYRVSINSDGSLKVLDKINDVEYRRLNFLEDVGDRGDEYNFCPVEGDEVISAPERVEILEIKGGGFFKSVKLREEYFIPESLSQDRESRSKKKEMLPIMIEYTFYRDIPRIDVRIMVENRCKDHKLMVNFRVPGKFEKVLNDGYFGLVEHPTRVESSNDYPEVDLPRYAMNNFVSLLDEKIKFMVVGRGLHEYETNVGEDHTDLKITLLRSVGWLSRGDLSTRKDHAGPMFITPKAQCVGKHVLRYSIIFPKEGSDFELFDLAERAILKPVGIPMKVGGEVDSFSFMELKEGLVLSCLKRCEWGDGNILRLVNLSNREIKFSELPIEKFDLVNMAEKKIEKSTESIQPGKVVTFRFP